MKKTISALLVALSLSTTVAPPQKAHAIVGAATGSVPGIILGGIAMGVGAMGSMDYKGDAGYQLSAAFIILFGLVMLDNNGQADFAFGPVSAESGARIGMNASEVEAYNHELAELNAIRERVGAEATSVESAASLWKSYQNSVSPEAFSAAQKIASAALK